jgi:hypothetical protein
LTYKHGYRHRLAPSLSFLPPISMNWDIAAKVAPVTAIFVAMIVFNNFCLQYVEVSFYQVCLSSIVCSQQSTNMHRKYAPTHRPHVLSINAFFDQVARAWTTIFTIVFSFLLLNETTSLRVCLMPSSCPSLHHAVLTHAIARHRTGHCASRGL